MHPFSTQRLRTDLDWSYCYNVNTWYLRWHLRPSCKVSLHVNWQIFALYWLYWCNLHTIKFLFASLPFFYFWSSLTMLTKIFCLALCFVLQILSSKERATHNNTIDVWEVDARTEYDKLSILFTLQKCNLIMLWCFMIWHFLCHMNTL